MNVPRTTPATRRTSSRSGPVEHPVTLDARVHELRHAAAAEGLKHRLDGDLGLLGPAGGGEPAVSAVDRHHHPVAMASHSLVEEVLIPERSRAQHDPGGARLQRRMHRSRLRKPPPSWTGTPTSAAIRRTCSRLTGSPLRAPSRSTTCKSRAPPAPTRRAASSGSASYTVGSSKSPRRQPHRLALERMSIAGRGSCAAAVSLLGPDERAQPRKVPQHPRPGRGLLRMELDAEHRVAGRRRGEGLAVLRSADHLLQGRSVGRQRITW